MHINGLCHNVPHRHAGVEGGIGILENNLGTAAILIHDGTFFNEFTVKPHLAPRRFIEMQQRTANRRFSAARFSDKPQGLSAPNGKRYIIDSF
ncbi:hypothetical protein SDC9_106655 [bioreactor metagenome]|uniref:Uncharacterized protein n=1 Tax=bioreactor metagenome TaxID=1076179 RepID=A0A645B309_9ZZZZ